MIGGNPEIYSYLLKICDIHILITPNIIYGDLDWKSIDEKTKAKFSSALLDQSRKLNQITDFIDKTYPHIMGHLNDGMWMHNKPCPFLG